MNEEWMAQAKCLDQHEIFDIDNEPAALLLCAICPVRDDCLDYSLVNHIEYGIWGGLNYRKRRKISRLEPWRTAGQEAKPVLVGTTEKAMGRVGAPIWNGKLALDLVPAYAQDGVPE